MAFKTEKQAQAHCAEILSVLGDSWTGEVWDNLGWHCKWEWGSVSLRYSSHGEYYYALVGTPGSGTGHVGLCPGCLDVITDPKEAVKWACDAALKIIERDWRKPIKLSLEEVLEGIGK